MIIDIAYQLNLPSIVPKTDESNKNSCLLISFIANMKRPIKKFFGLIE